MSMWALFAVCFLAMTVMPARGYLAYEPDEESENEDRRRNRFSRRSDYEEIDSTPRGRRHSYKSSTDEYDRGASGLPPLSELEIEASASDGEGEYSCTLAQ